MDEFVAKHDQVYVVEMNRDGQLHQLLRLANPESAMKLISVAHGDGLPAAARWVRDGILAKHADEPKLPAKKKTFAKASTARKKIVSKNGKKGVK